jgi:hypothetical protein
MLDLESFEKLLLNEKVEEPKRPGTPPLAFQKHKHMLQIYHGKKIQGKDILAPRERNNTDLIDHMGFIYTFCTLPHQRKGTLREMATLLMFSGIMFRNARELKMAQKINSFLEKQT